MVGSKLRHKFLLFFVSRWTVGRKFIILSLPVVEMVILTLRGKSCREIPQSLLSEPVTELVS